MANRAPQIEATPVSSSGLPTPTPRRRAAERTFNTAAGSNFCTQPSIFFSIFLRDNPAHSHNAPASAASMTARVLGSSTSRVRQQIAPTVRAETPPSANTAATRGNRNRNATAIDNCPEASRFPIPSAAPTSATAASQPSQAHHCRPSWSSIRNIARSAIARNFPHSATFDTRAKWIIKSTTPTSWTSVLLTPIPTCSNIFSILLRSTDSNFPAGKRCG
ncbi:Uncharacterised protein [Mycobacteroides abscessus subsp. abscessus]|nr:Uncharacterised protein [Mycobacteroides abscessus subsp. abscessus]